MGMELSKEKWPHPLSHLMMDGLVVSAPAILSPKGKKIKNHRAFDPQIMELINEG